MSTDRLSTTAETTAPGRSKGGIALWTVQVITALAILGAGVSTVAGAAQPVAMFDQIGAGEWFRYLTGALEIAGAVGLLIPPLAGLAGFALALLWVGAVGTHLFVIGGSPVPALAFLVLTAAIGWARRTSIASLLRSFAR